jgi:hypothetical protein
MKKNNETLRFVFFINYYSDRNKDIMSGAYRRQTRIRNAYEIYSEYVKRK